MEEESSSSEEEDIMEEDSEPDEFEDLGLGDSNDIGVQMKRRRLLHKIQMKLMEEENEEEEEALALDPEVCMAIVKNIKKALPKISNNEHLNGLFQAVVASCCGDNISGRRLAQVLEIDNRTANKAKKKRRKYDANPTGHLLIAPKLTKDKISFETKQMVDKFICENIQPSSSAKNVVKKKTKGKVEMKAKHWRTEPIEALYDKYVDNNSNNWISFGAFYNRIPWYVHAKPQRSGLCVYHDRAYKIMKILKNFRTHWHTTKEDGGGCKCKCVFCSKNGCDHGNKSTDCIEGLCQNCSKVCCPLEDNSHESCTWTIAEYQYEKTSRGNKKLRQSTNTYSKSRKEFMKLWKEEMEKFKDHSEHVKYHKLQVKQLFDDQKKDKNMVIARWDFAENYVHESGSMVSTEHYGKEQSQLLIVSYWYHLPDSTTESPNIALKYMAFTSDYLAHNTVFFKKCLEKFIDKISATLPFSMDKLYLMTDGAQQHFKNKRSFNNVSITSESKGKKKKINNHFQPFFYLPYTPTQMFSLTGFLTHHTMVKVHVMEWQLSSKGWQSVTSSKVKPVVTTVN
jgi:hypothetical protein